MGDAQNSRYIEESVNAWIAGRQDELGSTTLKVRSTSGSSLVLETNGRLLQLIIPPSFWRKNAQMYSSEVFLVNNLGSKLDVSLESAVTTLNQKLQGINGRQDVFEEVLDHVALALQKLEMERPKETNKEALQVNHTISKTLWEGVDPVKGDAQTRLCNLQLASSTCLHAMIEDAKLGSATRLHAMIEDAKLQCEIAHENANETHGSYHDVLRWCDVSSDSEPYSIHLLMEIDGVVQDDAVAAALGFSLGIPVKLSLHFRNELLEQITSNANCHQIKPERWYATQETCISGKPRESKQNTRSYGSEVLMPELVAAYFDFLFNGMLSTATNLQSPDLFKNLEQCTSMKNPLIGLMCFLVEQFRRLPNWCVLCWNSLPFSVCRLRTCDRDFCLFRFEELGLGTPVLREVQNFPELVDFEISLALAAAYSERDVFEPFPAFLLGERQIRGRSGWFSEIGRPAAQASTVSQAVSLPSISTTFFCRNKDLILLQQILHSLPSVGLMRECSDEATLKGMLTKTWRAQVESIMQIVEGKKLKEFGDYVDWAEKPSQSYDVLRYILLTSRLGLHLLQDQEKLGFADAHHQFAVLHDSPEREAHFEQRRLEEGGSFFAFHGSSAENWYSILRNGLRCLSNTVYMSGGKARGVGLYLSSHMAISMAYSRKNVQGWWEHGSLQDGFCVLAICEVVNGCASSSNAPDPYTQMPGVTSFLSKNQCGIIVVPPEHEKDVAIRYILVFRGQAMYDRDAHIISEVDLLKHHRSLRSKYLVRRN